MGELPPGKEPTPELKFAHLAPDVWKALGAIERTGWVKRGVKNPETVQEHTQALLRIASSLEGGVSREERDELLSMLEVHDWPEVIHGDEQLLYLDAEQFKSGRAKKFENERRAMEIICEKMGEEGKKVMALWMRYATSDDPLASLARQIDKYQSVEQALQYEEAQDIPLFREFDYYEWSLERITHPILVAKMKMLEEYWRVHCE